MKKFLVFLFLFVATPAILQAAQSGYGWQMGTVEVPKCLKCGQEFQNTDQYTLHQLDTGHNVDTTAGRPKRERRQTKATPIEQEQTVPGSLRVRSTKRKNKKGGWTDKQKNSLIEQAARHAKYQKQFDDRQARLAKEESFLQDAEDFVGGMLEVGEEFVEGTFDKVEDWFKEPEVSVHSPASSDGSGDYDTYTDPDALLGEFLLEPTIDLGQQLELWQIEQMQMGLPIDVYIAPEQRQLYFNSLVPFDPTVAVQERDLLFTPEEQAALDSALEQSDMMYSCPHCAGIPMNQVEYIQHMQQVHGQ